MQLETKIKYLEWDSNFFGYKVGLINNNFNSPIKGLEKILNKAKINQYKLIYLKNGKSISFLNLNLKDYKILLADTKVTYSQVVDRNLLTNISPQVKVYSESFPNDELISLALQSGVHSRFAIDPNFKNQEFETLYKLWIEKSVTKEIAKEVWVSSNEEGLITGFITLGLKNGVPDIGLLAVDTKERGRSIGKTLIQTALTRVAEWGSKKIQVVTQKDNLNACQFYERRGFSVEKIEYIYHIWL